LPVGGEPIVHHVHGACALARREPDPAPEKIQEYITMTSKHRSQRPGLLLVWSQSRQLLPRAATSMIEEYRWERPSTVRTPNQSTEPHRPVLHNHGFRSPRLAHDRCYESTGKSDGHSGRHLGFLHHSSRR